MNYWEQHPWEWHGSWAGLTNDRCNVCGEVVKLGERDVILIAHMKAHEARGDTVVAAEIRGK